MTQERNVIDLDYGLCLVRSNLLKKSEPKKQEEEECASFMRPTICQGAQGKYYVVNGYKYDEHFPLEYAENHLGHELSGGSGPRHCVYCRKYGSILGVFVGYCQNCELNIYQSKRPGIINATLTTKDDLAYYLPYMRGVRLIHIGDRPGSSLFQERAKMKSEEEEKKKKREEEELIHCQKRANLAAKRRAKESISEEEWIDYWGMTPLTNKDLFNFANNQYL